MAYQLESMLKIRVMREDRAATDLTAARRALAAAELELSRRQDSLADYNVHKDERRDKIFDCILGHVLSQDQLDQARESVARIDEEGVLLSKAVTDAGHVVEEKQQGEDQAHARYVFATKEKTKIDMHKQAWAEEDRREQEYRADMEMEDFTGRRLTSDDDDSLD